ncbi:MAG: DUF3781 domain-containing protein [Lachnospiraceae bacterium]|nr:DUF3781 domain-containing protein [Lachnospiraceae bacterium]
MTNALLENLDRIHTTEMGVDRIRRNMNLGDIDVVSWCKEKILDKNSETERRGKNWYVQDNDCIITVNASSYTIITVHRR